MNLFCLQSITFYKACVCINKRIIFPIPLHLPCKLPHGLIFKTPRHAALSFNFHVSHLSSPQHLLPNLGQINLFFIEKPLSKILPENVLSSGVEMLSEAGAASGPGLPWEHPPELQSLLGSPAPFLVLFPLYGDCSTPLRVYVKVTDHRVGPNSIRGVYTGMQFSLKYNQKQLSTSWIQ